MPSNGPSQEGAAIYRSVYLEPTTPQVSRRDTSGLWRLKLLVLGLACLALYLVGADQYDLLTDDEVRYAEAGRCMVESGNWVIPEFNGYQRFQKPILYYWLQACAQALLGSSLWAARLPSAVAGAAVVLLTAQLGKSLWGGRAGLWAGIVLATTVEMVLLSRMVMTDVILLLFLQGGLTSFCLGQLSTGQTRKRWYLGMYVWLAFGFLTKGPIALVLPAAIIGPWLVMRGGLALSLWELRPWMGGLIVLAIAGPWFALAHYMTDGDSSRQFFLSENLGRFTGNVNKHEPPAIFYFLLLVPMTFPWAGLLPRTIATHLRAPLRNVPFAEAAPWCFLWQILLVVGVFTLSKTRVWTYTLPMFPALALLIGRWISLLAERQETSRRRWSLPFLLLVTTALVLTVGGWILPVELLPVEIRSAGVLWSCRFVLLALLVISVIGAGVARFVNLPSALTVLLGGSVAWYLLIVFTLAPAADRAFKQPVREASQAIQSYPNSVVITYMVHELGLNFHTEIRRVHHWRTGSLSEIAQALQTDQPVFVVLPPERLHEFDGLALHYWFEHPRFILGANVARDPRPELGTNSLSSGSKEW